MLDANDDERVLDANDANDEERVFDSMEEKQIFSTGGKGRNFRRGP